MNNMKKRKHKVLKAIGVILLVLLVLIAVFVVKFIWDSNQPTAKKNYWESIAAGGELEEKYMYPGAYETTTVTVKAEDENIKAYEIVYPSEMENSGKTYPVVVMVNGSSDPAKRHIAILEHLASYGFIVVSNDDAATGSGETTSKTLAYILAENENPDSIFYHKLDIDRFGISGGSQGACGALRAITEFENGSIYKTVYTGSCPSADLAEGIGWTYDVKKITIPWFMTASTGKDDAETVSPVEKMIINYENLAEGIPCVLARRKDCTHNDVQTWADGYMTAWFCWQLKNDETAAKVFTGDSPEIMENINNWQDVRIKNCD